jgi:hypothetical protein
VRELEIETRGRVEHSLRELLLLLLLTLWQEYTAFSLGCTVKVCVRGGPWERGVTVAVTLRLPREAAPCCSCCCCWGWQCRASTSRPSAVAQLQRQAVLCPGGGRLTRQATPCWRSSRGATKPRQCSLAAWEREGAEGWQMGQNRPGGWSCASSGVR